MTKQRLLFLIGIWVAVLPFLGFPQNIRDVFFLITGLGIILLSYFMYIQIRAITEMDQKGGGIFVDETEEEVLEEPVVYQKEIVVDMTQDSIDTDEEIKEEN